jgi:ferredoxin-NADP reductase
VLVELQHALGQALPGATPGSHIDLHLPNGLVRQYSLTNAQGEISQSCYQVAIGRDAQSRGGSAWIHDKMRVDTTLAISEPRNLFELDTNQRHKVLLIGAGIGITPIYAMAKAAASAGMDWCLVACARSASRLAFAEEIQGLDKERLHVHVDLEQGRPLDLKAWLTSEKWGAVYACGPAGLLDAIEEKTQHWPAGSVHMERFKAVEQDNSSNQAFDLVLSKSGQSLQVNATETALEALERCGIEHPYACREGLCGTCEVTLIEGQPDHRDSVLGAQDRAEGRRFIPCVSRCAGSRLVIDL